jgi:hypothetical protein
MQLTYNIPCDDRHCDLVLKSHAEIPIHSPIDIMKVSSEYGNHMDTNIISNNKFEM